MFTGLIQEVGKLLALRAARGDARLDVAAPGMGDSLVEGESVAVDGCCLTVERVSDDGFRALASPETLARTTLGVRRAGDALNLERALAVGDRLGGHFVTGHVDGTGEVAGIERSGAETWDVAIALPEALAAQCVEKGSIAIDGVSLTIARLEGDRVRIAVIPETWRRTSLSARRPGDRVNVETDLIGKYVARWLETTRPTVSPPGGLTREKLVESGFME